MSEEKKPLDLDELFGLDRPIKLKWQGKEYLMLRSEAFGAKELISLGRLQARMFQLQSIEEITDESVKELESSVDEILFMLCPKLPLDKIPFNLKVQAIEFYKDEQRKKAIRLAVRSIGATPSAN